MLVPTRIKQGVESCRSTASVKLYNMRISLHGLLYMSETTVILTNRLNWTAFLLSQLSIRWASNLMVKIFLIILISGLYSNKAASDQLVQNQTGRHAYHVKMNCHKILLCEKRTNSADIYLRIRPSNKGHKVFLKSLQNI